MLQISHNVREKVLPRSEVPVIIWQKFEVKQSIDANGISHSVVQSVDVPSVLDLPFRSFSMQSYEATGEITRLQFMSPKHVDTLDMYDHVQGDLSELSAKVDHLTMLQDVQKSIEHGSESSENV